MKTQLLLLLSFLLLSNSICAQYPARPDKAAYVSDFAKVLTEEEGKRLHRKLLDSYRNNEARFQIIIVTVDDMGGEEIKTYSQTLAQKWEVGDKGKNNGIVIFMAKQERKVRIEVGYGLEAEVTDMSSARIIDGVLTPRFKEGRFYEGFDGAIDQLIQQLGGKIPKMSAEDSLQLAKQSAQQKTADSLAAIQAARQRVIIPKPSKILWVNDYAGLFSKEDNEKLSDLLQDIGDFTNNKIGLVILTNKSIGDMELGEYTQAQLRAWESDGNQLPNLSFIFLIEEGGLFRISLGANYNNQLSGSDTAFVAIANKIIDKLKGHSPLAQETTELCLYIYNLWDRNSADFPAYRERIAKENAEKAKAEAEAKAAQLRSDAFWSYLALLFVVAVILWIVWGYFKSKRELAAFAAKKEEDRAKRAALGLTYNDYSDSHRQTTYRSTSHTYKDYSDRSSYSDYSDRSSYSDYSDSSFGGGSFGGGGADGSW